MPSLVAAVDVGSSSARAGLFDLHGHLIRRAEAPFATAHPMTDHAEHSSDDIWRAVCRAVRQALAESQASPDDVTGLAFDATCSLVMLDRSGAPVTASITGDDAYNVVMWADHRATAEADQMTATRHRVLDHVGGVMSPEMELPKLLWLKRHLPDAWKRYGLALDLTDFLTWKATGAVAVSACTVTCKWTYLNHEQPGWQQDFLAQIGLADLQQKLALPAAARPIGTAAGTLTSEAAGQLGLSQACIVGVGAIDAHAGGIGVLGGLAGAEFDSPSRDDRRHLDLPYGGVAESAYDPGGVGALLRRDAARPLAQRSRAIGNRRSARPYPRLAQRGPQARSRSPRRHGRARRGRAASGGSGVCRKSPCPAGLSRQPVAAGRPRLRRRRSRTSPRCVAAVARPALLRDCDRNSARYPSHRRCLESTRLPDFASTSDRGHAASPFLVQLYADAGNLSVVLPEQSDGVLLGTACIAASASGLQASVSDAARRMARDGRTIRPNPALRGFFDHRYRAFLLMHEQRTALKCLQ